MTHPKSTAVDSCLPLSFGIGLDTSEFANPSCDPCGATSVFLFRIVLVSPIVVLLFAETGLWGGRIYRDFCGQGLKNPAPQM